MVSLSIPEIYPKPMDFYQSSDFSGERGAPVETDFNLDKIKLFNVEDRVRERILAQLKVVKFRRFGRLRGTYAIIQNGLLAISKDGVPIKINTSSDNDWVHDSNFSQTERYCSSHDFTHARKGILDNWESYETLDNVCVLSENHARHNYYHFHICFLPKIRHLENSVNTIIVIPAPFITKAFQRELIARTWGSRLIRPVREPFKVKDPILLHEPFSADSIVWLRQQTSSRARRGNRKIYIARRSTMVGRYHGMILENTEFLCFLAEHGFEIVDFGAGEVSVEHQIAMLDGARVIMSAHGANLTNICYAEPEIAIIEILPYYWANISYMQIALSTNANYFGFVCDQVDAEMRMIVDIASLTSTVEQALVASS